MTTSSSESFSPELATTGRGIRGRGACAVLGVASFWVALFGGGLIGLLLHLLVELLMGRDFTGFWSNLLYETQAIVLFMFVLGVTIGGWMGVRSYGPAAVAASGKRPDMPFYTRSLYDSHRGFGAMLSTYFVPQWELLTGKTEEAWRIFPRVLAGTILAAPLLPMYFMGRDADFRLSIWVCGGLAVVIADCLLVNRIARWRANGELKPR